MATKKTKNQIEVIILYDTREQSLDYLKTIQIDKRVGSDGIKIIGVEKEICKPNQCRVSTGDVTFKWRLKDSNEEWKYSNLCIEIKKGLDEFSSLYTKDNRCRLQDEVNRAFEEKMDFYFLITDNLTELNKKILKIPKFKYSKQSLPTHTFFNHYMKFNEYLSSKGFREMLCIGEDIGFVIRRLVKDNIIKNKLQYL